MACDEPVIGLYGADPFTTDSVPQSVTFTSAQPMVESAEVHAYFNIPAPAGCDSPGTISGVVRVNEPWSAEGLLVLITAFPFTPWHTPTGAPAYFPLLTPQDTVFHFTPRFGTYYLSIWNNVAPPGVPTFYGAHGYTAGSDVDPDPVTLGATAAAWGAINVDISGNP